MVVELWSTWLVGWRTSFRVREAGAIQRTSRRVGSFNSTLPPREVISIRSNGMAFRNLPTEHVSLAADGEQDFWIGGIVSQLFRQASHVHVSCPRVDTSGGQSPDVFQNFLTRDAPSITAGKNQVHQ